LIVSPRFEDAVRYVSVYDRPYEYAFVVEVLRQHVSEGTTIVDIGSAGSVLPAMMAAMGYRVICFDVREWPIQYPGLDSRVGDLLNGPLFPPNSIDVFTCISTIEHVGLGRYGDKMQPDGDIQAMTRLREMLKPGGYLVLTVPYGKPAVVYPAHRIYDANRLEKLTSGFSLVTQKWFGPLEREDVYQQCSEAETRLVNIHHTYAITCCLLRKEA